MFNVQPDLAGNPDRLRWNARYEDGFVASFEAHPLAVRALSGGALPGRALPDGPVLELASGPSGSALLAAAAGRQVTAVDASDVALGLLATEAARRGLAGLITLVHADLRVWRPAPGRYSVVLCTGYWDRALFGAAADALARGGILGWEAFTADASRTRPRIPAAWCLGPSEPASLLPASFEVLCQLDLAESTAGAKRQLLARRLAMPGT